MSRRRALRSRTFATLAVVASVAVCASVHAQMSAGRQSNPRACVSRFDAGVDYFPDKATLVDAGNARLTYHGSYKRLEVRAGVGQPGERYVLLQCGAPRPRLTGDLDGAQVVTIPIGSLFAASPTHLALLDDLSRLDVLTGIGSVRFAAGQRIEARVRNGAVVEFAPASVIDIEAVTTARPSLLMTSGVPNTDFANVRQVGVPVVANYEWLEATALGRAEWIKVMAALLNEERDATRLYAERRRRYESLRARAAVAAQRHRPTVMTGRGQRGQFTIAGGRSYVARLIADAGGRYVWDDDTASGTATVDLEAQLARAADADVWINGGGWPTRASILVDEPRYAQFKAFRTNQVWVYERRLTAAGINEYWSRGVANPDLLLADLVKILHPTLVPEHGFQWYMTVGGTR